MPESKIIQFSDHKPQLSGWARCVKCGHEWVAIQPIPAVDPLECPECGLFRGYFKFPVEEHEDTLVFMCNHCSGTVFNLSKEYARCANCGFKHGLETVFG